MPGHTAKERRDAALRDLESTPRERRDAALQELESPRQRRDAALQELEQEVPSDGGGLLGRIGGALKEGFLEALPQILPGGVGDPRKTLEGVETVAKPFSTFAREGVALERAAGERLGLPGRVIDPLDVGDRSTVLRTLQGDLGPDVGLRRFVDETQVERDRLNFGQNLALDIGADPLNLIPGVGFTSVPRRALREAPAAVRAVSANIPVSPISPRQGPGPRFANAPRPTGATGTLRPTSPRRVIDAGGAPPRDAPPGAASQPGDVAGRLSEEPGALGDFFRDRPRRMVNKATFEDFVQNNVQPAFFQRFGDAPFFNVVRRGDEFLIEITAAGWEQRAVELGLERVPGQGNFYRIPAITGESVPGPSAVRSLPPASESIGGPPPRDVLPGAAGGDIPPPGGQPTPPGAIPAGTTTRIVEPLSSEVETSLQQVVDLAETARPINRAERIAGNARRSAEQSRRVKASSAEEARLRAEGVPAREAGARSLALQAGDLPGPELIPMDISAADINPLFEHVADIDLRYFTESNTRVALEKVVANQMPSTSEMELLRRVFGQKLITALKGKRSRLASGADIALDLLNAPRQVLTAYDVSAPLRQGVVLLPRHPGEWSKSVVTMFKALRSEGAAQADDLVRKQDRNWLRFTGRHAPGDSKNLFQADLSEGITALNFREEQFMSRLASKIPGIRASQRAYVTFLNKLRYDVMSNVVAGWERVGKEVTDTDLDQLALFLNRATGRGSLGEFGNKLAPILNTTFFSPRLLASRVQLPLSVGANPSKLARQQAAGDLVAFIGVGSAVLGLAALGGAVVELDPRSSDFGKVRIGNTTIEYWGGFQSLARYSAQFLLGQSKSVKGPTRGQIRDIPRFSLQEFDDPVWLRFTRSKLSPPAGFLADVTVFGNENFIGEPTVGSEDFGTEDILPEIGERLAPLFFQDMLDAFKDDRVRGLFKALPAGAGAGVTTFERDAP